MEEQKKTVELDDRFEEMAMLFYHELESWFNTNSFYCESCVEEFIRIWPGIYDRDVDFQRNTISLGIFYNGTLLREEFTEEEFRSLVKQMSCPHCMGPVTEYFSPYELRFDVPIHFETIIDEIADLAQRTPFLLLSHPFAKDVFDEIHRISKDVSLQILSNPLFRGRTYKPEQLYSSKDFMAPEKKDVKEGRYNHAGNHVYYLAEDPVTCFYECRIPEQGIMLARIKVDEQLKVLDLMDEKLEGNSIIQAIQWSSLLSSPEEGEGWHKPHYVFTRFVADVARAAGFDAIRYASVRFRGFNYVFLDYENVKQRISVLDFRYVSKDDIFAEREKKQKFF